MLDPLRIISVNVASPVRIGGPGTPKFYPAKTGICKMPVAAPVKVGTFGLDGDFIGNKKHHGGEDQAIYLYSREDYQHFESLLGRPCPAGQFGENLTVSGLHSTEACVGDRYEFGDIILEVTSPRIPCTTFAAHMEDRTFVKTFTAARLPGVYCRVLKGGVVEAGMTGMIVPFSGEKVTLAELFATYPYKNLNEETRRRYQRVPGNRKMLAEVTD